MMFTREQDRLMRNEVVRRRIDMAHKRWRRRCPRQLLFRQYLTPRGNRFRVTRNSRSVTVAAWCTRWIAFFSALILICLRLSEDGI